MKGLVVVVRVRDQMVNSIHVIIRMQYILFYGQTDAAYARAQHKHRAKS